MSVGLLKVGMNVDIQRTDGRVHSAVISGIAGDSQVITVEWFERGETKGKEIDLQSVVCLNPALFPPDADVPKEEPQEPAPEPPQRDQARAAAPKGRRPTTAGAASGVGPGRSNTPRRRNGASEPPQPAQPEPAKKGGMAGAGKAPRRKSNCLKEVERIRERREQRRAQQAAIKEQLDQEYDTSHPEWEFDAKIGEFRSNIEFKTISSSDQIEEHQICVCVRKRPLNKKEVTRKDCDVVTVPNKDHVIIHEPKVKVDLTKYLDNQTFRFDYVFDELIGNEVVYRYTAKQLVECIFEKGMATCFAYGQTGSGKTHTMGGDFTARGQQDCSKGIYALAARDVFKLNSGKYKKADLTVSCSFFEIYSGKVFDLLNHKAKLRVLEDGKQQVQVVGLKEEGVNHVDDVLKLLAHGAQVRTSGQTSANNHSSRSHAVFQIILRKKSTKKLFGKFSLIDLAGNERGADTSSSDRQTRMEGAEINKSLLALKECIRALGRKGAHLPFRASKLTQVLRDSFIGDNSKTCMIATISPGMPSCEHTLNTLRYADRVKELGPGGPTDLAIDMAPSAPPDIQSAMMSPQNSDLVLLRTTNEEEVTEELLSFHEKINHMQDMEEEIIDDHRSLIDMFQGMPKLLDHHKKLLKMTDQVDYDVEAYAKQLGELLEKSQAAFSVMNQLKDKVTNFREELQEEETMSRNIKSGSKRGGRK